MTYAASVESVSDQRRFGPNTIAMLPAFILVESEYCANSCRKATRYLIGSNGGVE